LLPGKRGIEQGIGAPSKILTFWKSVAFAFEPWAKAVPARTTSIKAAIAVSNGFIGYSLSVAPSMALDGYLMAFL
jgi:hypothetical protein